MYSSARVYALDIETDNSEGEGLNPSRARITQASVATEDTTEVFDGAEADLLAHLDRFLRRLPNGLIATWNGAAFDLPYLTTRAGRARVSLGLSLVADRRLTPKYGFLEGHHTAYHGIWESAVSSSVPHVHLDIAYAYRRHAREHEIPWSLKPVARSRGLDPVELDRERLHQYTPSQRAEYCASDAVITRQLALDLLGVR
ncbi:hypothetical protein [Bailinhaonella thermotolerans]|uniref:Uncharacterized protein n=1 Tax=Bailinhaonella thermotolerans TaxID=1070861 RepID=A0A3A4A698_9ACTN|nr:hypothetical protein [Bailinhaonella thermotolerans]RJL21237.1 hypothetical protein D5H75_37865 [Bailinhaonella thermotolerans]